MSPTRDVRRGFTLVELLVVISIIGVLMGLLLPAINAARESARKTQCLSNLKNLGYAALQHLDKTRRFPTGGWGTLWVGYADGGNSTKQPGGWVYNVLPYMEEANLHDLGQGFVSTQDTQMQTVMAELLATTQSIMSCPTRRSAQGWAAIAAYNPYDPLVSGTVDLNTVAGGQYSNKVARGDYAANAGVRYTSSSTSSTLGTIGTDGAAQYGCVLAAGTDYPTTYKDSKGNVNTTPFTTDTWSGVVFQRSAIGDGSIKDGLSRTYLFGEKFVDRKHSEDGGYGPDAGNMYSGMGPDNYRNTLVFPANYTINTNGTDETDPGKPALTGTATVPNVAMLSDQLDSGSPGTYQGLYGCLFGSAHSGGIVNFVFCDGAAKSISSGIDPLTHRYLGERNDGKILDDAMIGQ